MKPKSMSIYLAGPIDAVTTEEARDWREFLGDVCPTGVLLVSPAHAFFGANRATAASLDYMLRSIIHSCDGVLANLMDGPSFGTIREVEFAKTHGRAVAIAGRINSLLMYDLTQRNTVEEAFDALIAEIRTSQDRPQSPMAVMLGLSERPEQEEEDEDL